MEAPKKALKSTFSSDTVLIGNDDGVARTPYIIKEHGIRIFVIFFWIE